MRRDVEQFLKQFTVSLSLPPERQLGMAVLITLRAKCSLVTWKPAYRGLGLKAPVIHPRDEKLLARMGKLGRPVV